MAIDSVQLHIRGLWRIRLWSAWHRRRAVIAALLAVCFLFAASFHSTACFAQGCQELYDGVLRLHIVANSDSAQDQALKLQVRDRVLERAQQLGLGEGCSNKEQLEAQARSMLPELLQAAQETLRENGCDDPVTACVTTMYFDTREYEGFTMPAGIYRAVRLCIGQGQGHNWWCVLFPQMCLPVAFGEELEDFGFSSQQLRVLQSKPQYEPRFALLEWAYHLAGKQDLGAQ